MRAAKIDNTISRAESCTPFHDDLDDSFPEPSLKKGNCADMIDEAIAALSNAVRDGVELQELRALARRYDIDFYAVQVELIHVAAQYERTKLLTDFLRDGKVSLKQPGPGGENILHVAVRARALETVKWVKQTANSFHNIDLDYLEAMQQAVDAKGFTPLVAAVMEGYEEGLEELLPSYDEFCSDGMTNMLREAHARADAQVLRLARERAQNGGTCCEELRMARHLRTRLELGIRGGMVHDLVDLVAERLTGCSAEELEEEVRSSGKWPLFQSQPNGEMPPWSHDERMTVFFALQKVAAQGYGNGMRWLLDTFHGMIDDTWLLDITDLACAGKEAYEVEEILEGESVEVPRLGLTLGGVVENWDGRSVAELGRACKDAMRRCYLQLEKMACPVDEMDWHLEHRKEWDMLVRLADGFLTQGEEGEREEEEGVKEPEQVQDPGFWMWHAEVLELLVERFSTNGLPRVDLMVYFGRWQFCQWLVDRCFLDLQASLRGDGDKALEGRATDADTDTEEDDTCAICLSSALRGPAFDCTLPCGHRFCRQCTRRLFQTAASTGGAGTGSVPCPLCRGSAQAVRGGCGDVAAKLWSHLAHTAPWLREALEGDVAPADGTGGAWPSLGATLLMLAAGQGVLCFVAGLIGLGFDPLLRIGGRTCMHVACEHGQTAVVKYLSQLPQGRELAVALASDGSRPLRAATLSGEVSLVKCLVQWLGGDAAVDEGGETWTTLARNSQFPEVRAYAYEVGFDTVLRCEIPALLRARAPLEDVMLALHETRALYHAAQHYRHAQPAAGGSKCAAKRQRGQEEETRAKAPRVEAVTSPGITPETGPARRMEMEVDGATEGSAERSTPQGAARSPGDGARCEEEEAAPSDLPLDGIRHFLCQVVIPHGRADVLRAVLLEYHRDLFEAPLLNSATAWTHEAARRAVGECGGTRGRRGALEAVLEEHAEVRAAEAECIDLTARLVAELSGDAEQAAVNAAELTWQAIRARVEQRASPDRRGLLVKYEHVGVDAGSVKGETRLYQAAKQGRAVVVEWMLSKLSGVSAVDDKAVRRALSAASFHGHLPAVQVLFSWLRERRASMGFRGLTRKKGGQLPLLSKDETVCFVHDGFVECAMLELMRPRTKGAKFRRLQETVRWLLSQPEVSVSKVPCPGHQDEDRNPVSVTRVVQLLVESHPQVAHHPRFTGLFNWHHEIDCARWLVETQGVNIQNFEPNTGSDGFGLELSKLKEQQQRSFDLADKIINGDAMDEPSLIAQEDLRIMKDRYGRGLRLAAIANKSPKRVMDWLVAQMKGRG
ncbi:hypothetical protein CYMTET_7102 [Cymbomonas tetramitiformis]|uniref:RING-type domain-containing protein n=1 Tax=Cymbomonas tetramitiformis TaxID=36881 RepID=A0AAE0GXK9_9CHLO|nr:hypothetical protein CYMTET_7102 [Cymbomonas tetramitiformis]